MNNLARPNQLVSIAVDVRSELDLRIGAAFTRFQSLRLQKLFPQTLSSELISYGSCQFPTLGFVVERFKEIEQFEAEPFWKIKIEHSRDEIAVVFAWKRQRLFDQAVVQAIYDDIIETRVCKVVNVVSKPKQKWRPYCLDTLEFEKLALRKLKISSKVAMQIAERLYQKGYISYPRTETNQYPKDFDLNSIVEKQSADRRWAEFCGKIFVRGGPRPNNGKKTDQAHPPIHPLKSGSELKDDEHRVFELIARHFLASVSDHAKGLESRVEIEVADEFFEATGLHIPERNYLEVFVYDKWSDKELPAYRTGETLEPENIEIVESATVAPPLLTEADLINLMDKHGIGTDATHAEHIEKIKVRNYIGVQNMSLLPGELGMGLVEGYDNMGFSMSKPYLRAELEKDLKLIADGQKDPKEVLEFQLEKYKEKFLLAVAQAHKLDQSVSKYIDERPVSGGYDSSGMELPGGGAASARQVVRNCPHCACPVVIKPPRAAPPSSASSSSTTTNTTAASFSSATPDPNPPHTQQWHLSCQGFPTCRYAVWFPSEIASVALVSIIAGPQSSESASLSGSTLYVKCANHSDSENVHKVALKTKQTCGMLLSAALLNEDGKYVVCLFCNESVQTALNLRIPPSPSQPQQQQSSFPGHLRTNSQGFSNLASSSSSASIASASIRSSRPPIFAAPIAPGAPPPLNPGMSRPPLFAQMSRSNGNDTKFVNVAKVHPFTNNNNNNNNTHHQNNALRHNLRVTPPFNATLSSNNIGNNSTRNPPVCETASVSVMCECGTAAKQFTVKKEGPNTGREFYTCSTKACQFFQWKDQQQQQQSQQSLPQNQQQQPFSSSFSSSGGFSGNFTNTPAATANENESAAPNCKCNQPAKKLRVNKEGENKNRMFFACQKPRGQGCGFFQWESEFAGAPQSGPSHSHSGGWNATASTDPANPFEQHLDFCNTAWPPISTPKSRSSSSGSRGGGGGSRKCGNCHQIGHTRNKCPYNF